MTTFVKFIIFFLFLQPQFLQMHLSLANLTIATDFTLASNEQISTNVSVFKIHLHVRANTLNTNTSKYQHITPTLKNPNWLPVKQRIDYKICLLKYKKLTNQQPYRFTIVFHFRHILVPTRSSDSLVLSIPYVQIITWQKGFLCHLSTTPEFTPSWYPKLVFLSNIPFQASKTELLWSKWRYLPRRLSHLP